MDKSPVLALSFLHARGTSNVHGKENKGYDRKRPVYVQSTHQMCSQPSLYLYITPKLLKKVEAPPPTT